MCSVQQEDDNDSSTPDLTSEISVDKSLCTKCSLPAVIALRVDDIYCRDCFLVRATHRFRCEFGKSRLIHDKEDVLVAYSGGRSSSAMLHLVLEGLSTRAKKLRFRPHLVYVDDGCCTGHNSSLTSAVQHVKWSDVATRMIETGLPYHIFGLEQAFEDDLVPILSSVNDESVTAVEEQTSRDKSKLETMMKSATTETARQNLTLLLRKELLARIARKFNCEKIVLGDNATYMASRMLSSIAQGRGAQLPYEMGFADDRHGDVIFIKPLREFTEKEIELYNTLNNIVPLDVPQTQHGTSLMSIETLSRQFVTGLQAEHRNTLSIICRTGEKLEIPRNDAVNDEERCCLCRAPFEILTKSSSVGSSAVNALEFSHSMHRLLRNKNKKEPTDEMSTGCCKKIVSCDNHVQGNGPDIDTHKHLMNCLLPCLCYGCKLIVREMDDVGKLPHSVLCAAKEKYKRDQMRLAIEEFLISDEIK